MIDERQSPPYVADERTMLRSWLEVHRATLEWKCQGLSAEQLRERSVPPSTLSLLGLVRHMAEVERNWFRRVLAGEDAPAIYYTEAEPDADFDRVADVEPVEVFATWHAECDRARTLEAAAPSLDEVGAGRRHNQEVSLRWIMNHMIEEYARHNGHADFLRERIDGATGE